MGFFKWLGKGCKLSFLAIVNFLKGVVREIKRIRWPNKKDMITYSVATISFIVFFGLFYSLTDLIISGIKMLVA